jgi:type III secretion system YscI/HrpB-like protein
VINNTGVKQVTERLTERLGDAAQPTPDKASGNDITRFQQALAQPESLQPSGPDQQPSLDIKSGEGIEAIKGNPGDAILRGLERMRSEQPQTLGVNSVANTNGASLPSVQEVFQLQFALSHVTLAEGLISQVASKASQGVGSLLKSQ